MIDRIQPLPNDFSAQAELLKDKALDFSAVARERLAEGSEAVKTYIAEHPERALGIALGLGVFLGWLIKRR
jgi:ElaB/YqjD/DUF883 family membrane-anchored ribosome-binding protein